MSDKLIKCPFCGEGDFDFIGLKDHLMVGGCDVFEDVPTMFQEMERIKELKDE